MRNSPVDPEYWIRAPAEAGETPQGGLPQPARADVWSVLHSNGAERRSAQWMHSVSHGRAGEARPTQAHQSNADEPLRIDDRGRLADGDGGAAQGAREARAKLGGAGTQRINLEGVNDSRVRRKLVDGIEDQPAGFGCMTQ